MSIPIVPLPKEQQCGVDVIHDTSNKNPYHIDLISIGPDSLEHASLRPPNLTFEERFNFKSDQVQNDLQDVIKSVQLHDQKHRPTCRKKEPRVGLGSLLELGKLQSSNM